jgi:hypothetical protein
MLYFFSRLSHVTDVTDHFKSNEQNLVDQKPSTFIYFILSIPRVIWIACFYALYSTNRKKIAYISADWNDTTLYLSNADGSDKKVLIKKEYLLKL